MHTRKQKVRKVHFVALMDTRHIQMYEYIPVNVSKNNLKCGHKSERGVSTHAKNKKFLCVQLRKGTCFCRRVLLSLSFSLFFFFSFFLSSLTQIRALKLSF